MPSTSPPLIIDIHNHVISRNTALYPVAPMTGLQSTWSQERPVDDSGMRHAMAGAGVHQSVLVQASTCYGHDNRYVAACVQGAPAVYGGVFSVDLAAEDAIERIQYWMDQGLDGARVFIAGHTAANDHMRIDDPRSIAAWKYLASKRIPLSVQLRADKLGQLETMLQEVPDTIVLLDHCGRPVLHQGAPYADAQHLLSLGRYPNLYLKYTTHNVRESHEGLATPESFLAALLDAFGAQRLAWGSNFPASSGTLQELLAEALQATSSLSTDERAWIFGGTAASLYPRLQEHV